MNPGQETSQPSGALSELDVERLLATVANPAAPGRPDVPGAAASAPDKENADACDFRNPVLLPPATMRKLRADQEEFVNELASRLSLYLRLEISLKLARIQTISCQKLAHGWTNPTYLALFKLEPLRGVSVFEMPPRLGLCMVDRLMGGPGRASEHTAEISEIERVLLEQVMQLILGEWCGRWTKVKELRAVLLGHESNPRFVQVAAPETMMFVLSLQVGIGECTEKIQISIPFAPLELLIHQLTKGAETLPDAAVPAAARPAPPWNPAFSDLCVPVTAEWHATDMAARDVLALKPGDVIRMDPQSAGQITLHLGGTPRFQGRPGTVAGKWAVELTRTLNGRPD
jgi:flagellar motor switch protein FliM